MPYEICCPFVIRDGTVNSEIFERVAVAWIAGNWGTSLDWRGEVRNVVRKGRENTNLSTCMHISPLSTAVNSYEWCLFFILEEKKVASGQKYYLLSMSFMLSSRPLNTTYKLPFAVNAYEFLQTGCRPSLTTVSQPLCPRTTSCPMSWRESCIEHDFKSLRPKWRWDDFWIPQKGHVSSFHGRGSHLEVTWFQFFLKWRWPWSSTLGSRPWCLVSEKHIVKGSQLAFLKVSRGCLLLYMAAYTRQTNERWNCMFAFIVGDACCPVTVTLRWG